MLRGGGAYRRSTVSICPSSPHCPRLHRRVVSVSICVPPFCDVVERQFLKESTIVISVHLNGFPTLCAFDRGVTTLSEMYRSLTIIKPVNRKSASKVTAEVTRFRHAHFRSREKEIIDRLSPLSSTSLPQCAAILFFSRERIPPLFRASRSVVRYNCRLWLVERIRKPLASHNTFWLFSNKAG